MNYERAWRYLEAAGGAAQGDRNNVLNRLSYAIMERFPGLSQSEHMELMQRWGASCSPAMNESEVVKTASSAWHGALKNGVVGTKQKAIASRDHGFPRIASSRPPTAPPAKTAEESLPAKSYDLESASDDMLPAPMTDGTVQLLKTVFRSGEKIRIVPAVRADDGGEVPDGSGFVFTLEQWLERLSKANGNPNNIWTKSDRTGIYIGINPGGTKDSDISAFRHALIEFDEGLTLGQQWQLYQQSRLPIAAVIYSGGKSVHAWVKVDANSREEYQKRVGLLFKHFEDSGLKLDTHNRNPARLSRLPNCVRFDKRQELLALNIGAESWDAWIEDVRAGEMAEPTLPSDLREYSPFEDTSGLIGDRWLCRGGSMMIVGPSGVGKSSLTMQLAVSWAAGLSVFGVSPVRQLKIMIVQAENDFGDLAEQFQGVSDGLGITPKSQPKLSALVDNNLIFIRDTSHTGFGWVDSVHRLIRKYRPDIVIGDPLLSFVGGDISRQEVCGQFLRNWLGPIQESTGVAWVFVHHTGKPPSDKEARKGWHMSDWSYAGIGSSELTNWARAVVTLRQAGPNVFTLAFTKRGARAGATHPSGEPTDTIWIRHSSNGIYWEQVEPPEEPADDGEKPKRSNGRPSKEAEIVRMNLHDFLSQCSPDGETHNKIAERLEGWLARRSFDASRATCKRAIPALVSAQKLTKTEEGKYLKGPNA
jgi:RecA-family ATPase